MTHPTDEELDALDAKLASQIGDDVTVIFNHEYLFKQSRAAIDKLRLHLDSAHDKLEIERALTDGAHRRAREAEAEAHACGAEREAWKTRAEQAEQRVATLEAALAAQIEADARIAEDAWLDGVPVAEISAAIRAHSHDCNALDRMLAEHEVRLREARENALREAALMAWNFEDGDRWTRASVQAAILRIIDKDKEN